jgi:hypothetical protein
LSVVLSLHLDGEVTQNFRQSPVAFVVHRERIVQANTATNTRRTAITRVTGLMRIDTLQAAFLQRNAGVRFPQLHSFSRVRALQSASVRGPPFGHRGGRKRFGRRSFRYHGGRRRGGSTAAKTRVEAVGLPVCTVVCRGWRCRGGATRGSGRRPARRSPGPVTNPPRIVLRWAISRLSSAQGRLAGPAALGRGAGRGVPDGCGRCRPPGVRRAASSARIFAAKHRGSNPLSSTRIHSAEGA